MLIATSRQPLGDPGTLFSGERSRQLTLATIDVSIPAIADGAVAESAAARSPRKDFVVTRVEPMTPPQMREWPTRDGSR